VLEAVQGNLRGFFAFWRWWLPGYGDMLCGDMLDGGMIDGVHCVECWGTSWRSEDSCGQAGNLGVGLLHRNANTAYDVSTSTATETGELREARGAEKRDDERRKLDGILREAPQRSSTP
jgi:hypothetical protein